MTIPEGVTTIGEYAFYCCTGLASVTIPEGVTTIGEFAFSNCTGLRSVTIPGSVTAIGSFAFMNCEKLATIHFTGTTEQWKAIEKGFAWIDATPSTLKIICTNGELSKSEA